MELRHFRYFTAVVQWKGYREASRRLHIAQPAISQTIADLEQELGLKLFSRAKRSAQLTPEGEVFYAEAVRTLAQAELANQYRETSRTRRYWQVIDRLSRVGDVRVSSRACAYL
jgi:DNA-binding transcriptional LysR family regulator